MGRQEATGTRPFVNRNGEREWLEERLDTARSGLPQLVLISGEPGIGKSRLARELQHTAGARGVDVFPSRCREHLDLPYLPFTASLLPRLQLLAREDPALSRYAPVIERVLGDDANSIRGADPGPEPPDRTLVFVAVATATIRLAHIRPVLLVVDDLQWADSASLDLFTHLALEIADTSMREPVPVMIAATHRHDARLPSDVERLRREEICHELRLRPLPAARSRACSAGSSRSAKRIGHLRPRDWLGRWWTDVKDVEDVLRAGYRAAIERARDLELPLESLWVCANEGQFQVYFCEGPRQVTVIVFTPPPEERPSGQREHTDAPLAEDEPIWVVKRKDPEDDAYTRRGGREPEPVDGGKDIILRRIKYA